jgi:hypothetical protein
MARGIAESGLFRQERVKLNGRTSDPSNPEPGESWLRFDLDGETDKYGEFRVYDGSSVQSVAIVAPGTTQTEAEEVLRVQTPSGVGVIPVSPRADASIPQWSFQHNGNSLGLGQPSAIPDSADLHHGYDVRELSLSDGNTITNIPDENGDDLDSTSTGPTYKTGAFGGTEPVARFNGSDQYIEVTSANFTSVQTAYTVFFSGSLNDSSGTQFATGGSDDDEFDFSSDGSNWFFYTDEGTSNYEAGGTPDENDHIFAFRGDGNNSEIWIDNSQVTDSPNTDTSTIDAISWGRDGSGNDYGKWDITEMLIYDGDKLGKQKIWDHMDRNTNIL